MMMLYVKYTSLTRGWKIYKLFKRKSRKKKRKVKGKTMSEEKCSNNYRSLIKKLISSFMLLIMILILLLLPSRYVEIKRAPDERLPKMLFAVAESKTFISLILKTLALLLLISFPSVIASSPRDGSRRNESKNGSDGIRHCRRDATQPICRWRRNFPSSANDIFLLGQALLVPLTFISAGNLFISLPHPLLDGVFI